MNDKNPIEDTLISNYDKAQPPVLCNPPEWTIDPNLSILTFIRRLQLKLTQVVISVVFKDLYMGWNFVHRFSKEVAVSRFPFHDWIWAVHDPESSQIYVEVVLF